MNLRDFFIFNASRTTQNRVYFERILDLAKIIPPGALSNLYAAGVRANVFDTYNKSDRDIVFASAIRNERSRAEYPASYWPRGKRIELPLRQKMPGMNVWFDCYDYTPSAKTVRAQKNAPHYLKRRPHIRTKEYRGYLLAHETGHACHATLAQNLSNHHLNAFTADQKAIKRSGIPIDWKLEQFMSADYGGLWPEKNGQALREITADCFAYTAEPKFKYIDTARYFPRTLEVYQKLHQAFTA